MLKILKGGSTMREVQDPKRDMMNTMNVIDASARAAGAGIISRQGPCRITMPKPCITT